MALTEKSDRRPVTRVGAIRYNGGSGSDPVEALEAYANAAC